MKIRVHEKIRRIGWIGENDKLDLGYVNYGTWDVIWLMELTNDMRIVKIEWIMKMCLICLNS